jgi:hypothetical protein
MEQSTTIEFKTFPLHIDLDDLNQECTAYMKTKQFMAKRIVQQQEEIEQLKQALIYHSGKHLQTFDLLKNMQEQFDLLKELKKEKPLDLSNEEIVNSFICPEDSKEYGVDNFNYSNDRNFNDLALRKENIDLTKELERLRVTVLEKTLEINKLRSDKFLLHNELSELLNSLKKVDMDKLNNFYKHNLNGHVVTKSDLPSIKGVKYNIMSAQSQLVKILKSDLIKTRLETDDKVKDENKIQLNHYNDVLKSIDNDFDALLDKKLAKKSRFYYNL